jgi:hypothetical protein
MRRRLALALAPTFALALPFALTTAFTTTGCSSASNDAQTPCEGVAADQAEACLTNAYFQGYDPDPFQACPYFVPTTQKVGARREVGLYRSATILDADVTLEGRLLQRFYAPYDLTFFATKPPEVVSFTYALSGTSAEFAKATADAGVTPGTQPTPDQAAKLNQLVDDILFRDLRAFVLSTSSPPAARVDVVILDQIASPDVASQITTGGVIAGLGLSPALFRNLAANDPSKDLFTALALPADFTPTLFVGHSDVTKLARNAEAIVAHEMGHALGLEHATDPGDLMTQGQGNEACLPGLTNDQVAQLRTMADTVSPEGVQFLLDAKKAVVEHLLSGR